jgi:tetratricopeptide (TPR) repeat protein
LSRIKFKYKVIAAAVVVMLILKFVFDITNFWAYVLVIVASMAVVQYYRKNLNKIKKPRTIEELNQFVERKPDDADAYYYRAQAYITKFRTEENSSKIAEKDLSMTIKLAPDHFHAYEARGFLRLSNNNHKKAIPDLTKAIQLNPDSSHTYYSRAIAYTQINNFKKALTDYEKVNELNPDNAAAFRNKGNILFKLNKYKAALNSWEKAIELKPELKNDLLPIIKGTKNKLS